MMPWQIDELPARLTLCLHQFQKLIHNLCYGFKPFRPLGKRTIDHGEVGR